MPLPPAPTRQLLNEVALEVPEHLGYLTLFWSEEALPPDIARDHIREIGARLAEIAMLMPRVKTARAAERAAADALDAASAPASRKIGLAYLALALAKRLTRDAGSPGFTLPIARNLR